jgi:CHAT domain-containing protein
MVSSYTPSILSLVRASSSFRTLPRNKVKGLAVYEGSPLRGPDLPPLPKVKDEVRLVRGRFEAAEATITVINDVTAHPTVSEVLTSLQSSDVNILHLSCHGVQQRDPLASAFIFRDGDLTIQELMKLDLKRSLLTFLSACQTAKGSEAQPDQAVHLAASMLFCGFKSAIATMWCVLSKMFRCSNSLSLHRSMADANGPIVASSVYNTLFKEDEFNLDDVPYALDDAVRLLRDQKKAPERWAVFVHMGA